MRLKITQGFNETYGRVKFVLPAPWVWNEVDFDIQVLDDERYSQITTMTEGNKTLYKKPSVAEMFLENRYEASIVFNETITTNKAFQIIVKGIQNPFELAAGVLKVYTMEPNSNEYVEKNENDVTLEVKTHTIDVNLGLTAFPFDISKGLVFYKDSIQYVKVTLKSTKIIPSNYYLKVNFGNGSKVIKGTGYLISGASQYNTAKDYFYEYQYNEIIISNLASIAANTIISLSVRVNFSAFDINVCATGSFDKNKVVTIPLFQGISSTYSLYSNSSSRISLFQGLARTATYLSITPLASFNLNFQFASPIDVSAVESYLEIYISKYIKAYQTFSNATDCTISTPATFPSCNLQSTNDYTTIKLVKPAGNTYFSTTARTYTLKNLMFQYPSDHYDHIYEYYFRWVQDATNYPDQVISWMLSANVMTAQSLAGFSHSCSGNIYQNSDLYYPSFINLVLNSNTLSSYSINSGEQKVITMFSKRNLKHFNSSIQSQDEVNWASTITGVRIVYIEGQESTDDDPASSYINVNYLDWDRFHIFFNTQIDLSQAFHLLIPILFDQSSSQKFKFLVGVYKSNRAIEYKYEQSLLTCSCTTTYGISSSSMQLELRGYAGTQQRNITLTFSSSSASAVGSAVIISSAWQIWDQSVSCYDSSNAWTSISNSDARFAPLGMRLKRDNQINYVLYIPIIGTTSPIYLDKIYNPLSLDVPYYSIFTTQSTGTMDYYNVFRNTGYGTFISQNLKSLTMSCLNGEMHTGEINRICEVGFIPNNQVKGDAQIVLQFDGIVSVKTSLCEVEYIQSDVWKTFGVLGCAVEGANNQLLRVKVQDDNNNGYGPQNIKYRVRIYGVDFNGSTISTGQEFINCSVAIKDQTSSYSIEQNKIYFSVIKSQGNESQAIQLTSISYSYRNPTAISSLYLRFSFPRNLYTSEKFYFSLGQDINDVNKNTDKLQILFYDEVNNAQMRALIQFQDIKKMWEVNLLGTSAIVAGKYNITVNGMVIPGSNENSNITLAFVRTIDSAITLQNTQDTSVSFPSLITKTSQEIRLCKTNYLLEGSQMQLTFEIAMYSDNINSDTIMYIYFPFYYTPGLVNQNRDLYCKTGEQYAVKCSVDGQYPYRLQVENFAVFYQKNTKFNFTVLGIISPQYSLRYSSSYENETIFIAVDTYINGTLSEMMHIMPPATQQLSSSVQVVNVKAVTVENKIIRQLSQHVLEFEIADRKTFLVDKGVIIIGFPDGYEKLKLYNTITCQVLAGNSSQLTNVIMSGECQVFGFYVKAKIEKGLSNSEIIQVKILNVPTPFESKKLIRVNDFEVIVAEEAEQNVLGRSYKELNEAYVNIQYTDPNNYLIINNDKEIELVKGTYSSEILINTQNNKRFQNDIIVNTEAAGFTFSPKSLILRLGDLSYGFKIAVDKDLMAGTYQLNFEKSENGLSDFYQNISTVIAVVTAKPIIIQNQYLFKIPFGGCALPYKIELEQSPLQELFIVTTLDDNMIDGSVYVDTLISDYNLQFLWNNSIQYMKFCIKNDTSLLSYQIGYAQLQLSGINLQSYELKYTTIKFEFEELNQTDPDNFTSEITSVGKTEALITIKTNTSGLLFWKLLVVNEGQNITTFKRPTYSKIKQELENNNMSKYTSQSEQVNLEILDVTIPIELTRELSFAGLSPETNYFFITYLENQFGQISNYKESYFATKCLIQLDYVTKLTVKFSQIAYKDLYNTFLCQLVRYFYTRTMNVFDANTESCSYYIEPNTTSTFLGLTFNYTGITYSTQQNQTSIYFFADESLEVDVGLTSLNATIKSSNLELFSGDFQASCNEKGIDFVKSLQVEQYFKFSDALLARDDFEIASLVRKMQFQEYHTSYNYSLTIYNIQLSQPGQIYFTLQAIKRVSKHPVITGAFINTTLRVLEYPTVKQIINCKNYLNAEVEVCGRIVQTTVNEIMKIEIWGLQKNTIYQIFWAIANEVPRTIVVGKGVVEADEAQTYTDWGQISQEFQFWVYILCILSLWLLY